MLNCEYTIASFSSGERKKRAKGGRQSVEMSLLIQQVFESAVLTGIIRHDYLLLFNILVLTH